MTDLADGESVEMQGSGSRPYVLKNTGGVYSCSCPAWRNQSIAIERRTCKHLKKLRGEAAELARIGTPPTEAPAVVGEGVGPDLAELDAGGRGQAVGQVVRRGHLVVGVLLRDRLRVPVAADDHVRLRRLLQDLRNDVA